MRNLVEMGRARIAHRGIKRTLLAAAIAAVIGAGAISAPTVLGAPAARGGPAADAARPASFADLAERVGPAVVFIATAQTATPVRGAVIPPELRRFFGPNFDGRFMPFESAPGRAQRIQGVGSGFLISADGYVVTNNHVVDGAEEVTVKLSDGTELPAKVEGTDPKTDLALLKIDSGRELPYVEFGDSDSTRVGDWVIAVGNPFGLGGSVSAGIVSARGRHIDAGPYDDFIQTDAPINQGNSGGPLFDAAGKVVGVNTAIFSPSGGNVGIGFAVPAAIASPVVAQLKSSGRVDRGWLGVRIQDISEDLAAGLGLHSTDGALVAGVEESSPAARAGVEVGDVVQAVDGVAVAGARELSRAIAAHPSGGSVEISLWRDAGRREVRVELSRPPGEAVASTDESRPSGSSARGRIGLAVADLTAEARSRWRLDDAIRGAVITGVEPGSPAAERELRPGDVIVQVGRRPVRDVEELARLVHAEKEKRVVLLVSRNGAQRFVALDLAQS